MWIDQIQTRAANYDDEAESPPKEIESAVPQGTQPVNIHTICMDAQNDGSPAYIPEAE